MTDWGEYGDYGGCSKTCGGGTKTRTRPCLPPGSVCVGDSTEVVECNKEPCAGKCRIFILYIQSIIQIQLLNIFGERHYVGAI